MKVEINEQRILISDTIRNAQRVGVEQRKDFRDWAWLFSAQSQAVI